MIEKEDELFRPIVQQIFEETQGRIGAKKIRAIMMTQGYTISPERISRLMKEMGLVCISTIPRDHNSRKSVPGCLSQPERPIWIIIS